MKHLFVAILTVALLVSSPMLGYSSKGKTAPTLVKKSLTKPVEGKNRLIVKYKKNISLSEVKGLYKSKKSIRGNAVSIKAKSAEAAEKVEKKLEDNPGVEYVEPDYVRKLSVTPNDSYYSLQYGLSKMQAPSGWNIERGYSNSIIIAVVDTGVDINHPDLKDKIVSGWDFVNNDNNPQDDHGHGTHVAGIAAASTNNGTGVAGVSWGAKIMPIKVLNSSGNGYDSWVANGIRYAADHGANIINLSLGGAGYSSTLRSATDYAYSKNVLVVAAAGNSGDTTMNYPAGNPNVLGVGATDSKDKVASFSTHNSSVDVSAPGVSIASSYWYYGSHVYAYMSGTSMATPNVAGLASLVKSRWPSFSAAQVAARIMYYSDDKGLRGKDIYYGYGRVNAYRALNSSASRSTYRRLSIAANRKRIRTGRRVWVKGRIRPSSSGKVTIRYKKGKSGWRTLRRVTLKSSIYKTKVRLNSRGRYVFAAKFGSTKSRSMALYAVGKRVKVKAKRKLSINASAKRLKAGRRIRLSGRYASKRSGTVVIKYKKGNSKWKVLKRVRLRSRLYRTIIRLNSAGKYVFSARVGSATTRNMAVYVLR